MVNWLIFYAFLITAFIFHIAVISKVKKTLEGTGGNLQNFDDLKNIKETINLSMRLAIIYIVLCVFFGLFIISLFMHNNGRLGLLMLFSFSVITLIIGLIGKKYENRIKKMNIITNDESIRSKYYSYIKMWDEARFQLPD